MRSKKILDMIVLAFLTVFPARAWSCIVPHPATTDGDLLRATEGMAAFKGKIVQIIPYGAASLNAIPHGGFQLRLKVVENVMASRAGDLISVDYGPCSYVPGAQGAIVPVLAILNSNGLWHSR